MSFQIKCVSTADPAIGAISTVGLPGGLQDIYLVPSQGTVLFLESKQLDALKDENQDENYPTLADKKLESIGNDTQASELEKKSAINQLLFGNESTNVAIAEEAMRYYECISLATKEMYLVSKKFIEDLMENQRLWHQLFPKPKKGDDLFADYRDPATGDIDPKFDIHLRDELIKKLYPKVFRKESKEKEGGGELTYEAAKQLVESIDISKDLKEFFEGTHINLAGEWEAKTFVIGGKRNYSHEADKDAILELLGKKEFNQDDADKVLRKIRDLWEGTLQYGSLTKSSMGIPYESKDLYKDESLREELKKKVGETKVPPEVFEATLEGSVLRAAAKLDGKMDVNLAEGKINAEFEAEAEAMLAKGKASASFKIPNENGHHAYIACKRKKEVTKWVEYDIDGSAEFPANFHFDSSFVAPHTAMGIQQQLNQLAAIHGIFKAELLGLDIIGHTDAVGAASYNHQLGLERAQSTYDFIKEDLVGLAHNFQQGRWGIEHIEMMQAVVHISSRNLWVTQSKLDDFNTGPVSLRQIVFDPHAIVPGLGLHNKISLQEHHAYLKSNYEAYKQLSTTKIPTGADRQPSIKSGTRFSRHVSNDYLLSLLKAYRRSLWDSSFNVSLDKVVQYREGIASRGEHELLVNTSARNEANRRVVLKGYFHDKTSHCKYEDSDLDFGYFRMDVEGSISGFAGANILLSGAVDVSVNPNDLLIKGVLHDKTYYEKKESIEVQNTPTKKTSGPEVGLAGVGAEAEGKAEVFAGAQAEAELKGALLWNETKIIGSGYSELGSVGYAVNASAGIGMSGEFKIGYDNKSGRFVIKAKASATLGVGCGGKVEFTVGLGGLWAFAKYVYDQLKENDFDYVDLFDDDSYNIFISWYLRLLQKQIDLASDAANAVKGLAGEATREAQEILAYGLVLTNDWRAAKQEKDDLERLVESIESNQAMLHHCTPEVKGRVLYLLTQYRTGSLLGDVKAVDWNHRSEAAAVKLIRESIVSKRDWQETFEHMAQNAAQDGLLAKAYQSSGNKGRLKTAVQLADNQQRMIENENWLKTYLLNDANDWQQVLNKRKELWQ